MIVAGEPGAMSLSPGSNRSTANRTGASGSTGGAPSGSRRARGSRAAARALDAAASAVRDRGRRRRAAGRARRRARRRPPWPSRRRAGRVWLNATDAAPAVAGASSTVEPSGRVTTIDVAPAGIGRVTGSPGREGRRRRRRAAEQLAGEVRDEQREGHLERQVGVPWQEREDARRAGPSVSPTYSRGAPAGPGMTVRAHVGVSSFVARPMWTRREVDELEDRLVRGQRPDARVRQRAGRPRRASLVAGGAISSTADAAARASAGCPRTRSGPSATRRCASPWPGTRPA